MTYVGTKRLSSSKRKKWRKINNSTKRYTSVEKKVGIKERNNIYVYVYTFHTINIKISNRPLWRLKKEMNKLI